LKLIFSETIFTEDESANKKMESIARPSPQLKPVVKSTTMSAATAQEAINCSVKAIEENTSDKAIASSIRKAMQSKHTASTWNCFVGRDLVSTT
jgi:hypothetical protein